MSHAKIGRFSKKQIFELPDGTHRLEPHLYVRVRGKSPAVRRSYCNPHC